MIFQGSIRSAGRTLESPAMAYLWDLFWYYPPCYFMSKDFRQKVLRNGTLALRQLRPPDFYWESSWVCAAVQSAGDTER
jgi:hypothetical protein